MIEENKAHVRQDLQMFELGNPSMADAIVATDYKLAVPDPSISLEGIKGYVNMFKKAMPDAQVNIAYQFAVEDKVVSLNARGKL